VASYEEALRSGVVQTETEYDNLKRAIGGPPMLIVRGDRSLSIALTDQAAALQFFQNSVQSGGLFVPLSNYTQVRLVARTGGAAGAATAVLRLRYRSTFSGTAADYLAISTDDVNVSLAVANTAVQSTWTDLVPGAQGDVYLSFLQEGGDGVADPVVGYLAAYFR